MKELSQPPHQILGVRRDASREEVKRRYHQLARQYHPDKNIHRQVWADIMFKELKQAYEIMTDHTEYQKYMKRFGKPKRNSPNDSPSGGYASFEIWEDAPSEAYRSTPDDFTVHRGKRMKKTRAGWMECPDNTESNAPSKSPPFVPHRDTNVPLTLERATERILSISSGWDCGISVLESLYAEPEVSLLPSLKAAKARTLALMYSLQRLKPQSNEPRGGRHAGMWEATALELDSINELNDFLEKYRQRLEEIFAAVCPRCRAKREGESLRWSQEHREMLPGLISSFEVEVEAQIQRCSAALPLILD
ncbi:Chaperone protein DnaJ [Cyphellophora attinorum]|uniref:Chaperone protein DnaJ n=1 Tax=Cyphellophora attinorum TaxID=1664694 RepID=A0A0N1HRS9_9EURO|nr:Chaperone protein DnaJ [Phialophora attinorum]KPI41100.1 Chaperone protein DnaJ [Phialophora attinorum]